MKLDHEISKDRAIPRPKKYLYIAMAYACIAEAAECRRDLIFCPAARFAVCVAYRRSVIA
jgi:hypothetical protein